MKALIPMDEYGMFADMKETPRLDSRYVAEFFGKNHKNVLRDIEKITGLKSELSEKINAPTSEEIEKITAPKSGLIGKTTEPKSGLSGKTAGLKSGLSGKTAGLKSELREKKKKITERKSALSGKTTDRKSALIEEFVKSNFAADKYLDATGRKLPCYQMTRDGFTLLVMGYTGEKAMRFKVLYIKRFNEMEAQLKSLREARRFFPELTDGVGRWHENPKAYHFTNEIDMINRIALGVSAKQFRQEHGIADGESIRPHLTPEQIFNIERLQAADVGLLMVVPDFAERKARLEAYFRSISAPKLRK